MMRTLLAGAGALVLLAAVAAAPARPQSCAELIAQVKAEADALDLETRREVEWHLGAAEAAARSGNEEKCLTAATQALEAIPRE